jgi:hypothetical protein
VEYIEYLEKKLKNEYKVEKIKQYDVYIYNGNKKLKIKNKVVNKKIESVISSEDDSMHLPDYIFLVEITKKWFEKYSNYRLDLITGNLVYTFLLEEKISDNISRMFSIGPDRIRKLKANSLSKLRNPSRTQKFKKFLDN